MKPDNPFAGFIRLDGVDADRLELALIRWDDEDADYITHVAVLVLKRLRGLGRLQGDDFEPTVDME